MSKDSHSQSLTGFSRYLLVDAHPDDEVHCAALLHRLLAMGKFVQVVVITRGDAGQNPEGRLDEMRRSAEAIGLSESDVTLLGRSEYDLLKSMAAVYDGVMTRAQAFKPDCLLSIDFDGGHEGHDTASFIADVMARKLSAPHAVFPDYNYQHGRRYGLEFLPGRPPSDRIELTPDEKDLKITVLEAHAGQLGFYLRMQKTQDTYFKLFFERELFRWFPPGFDFLKKPDYPLGYEFHRNGFKHANFVSGAQELFDMK